MKRELRELGAREEEPVGKEGGLEVWKGVRMVEKEEGALLEREGRERVTEEEEHEMAELKQTKELYIRRGTNKRRESREHTPAAGVQERDRKKTGLTGRR
jgi:hypothetical protein